MGAPGRVHMVVAGVPTRRCQVDPPLHPEPFPVLFARRDLDGSLYYPILWTASVRHMVPARRKQNLFAVFAIDLIVKEEIRRKSSRARGIHTATRVTEDEVPCR